MDPRVEATLKLTLCVLAIAVIAIRHRRSCVLKAEQAGQVLIFAAIVAGLAYTNFGEFNGWPPIHAREMFHYFLGSKYFPELRYDGIYVASHAAQLENSSEYEAQEFIRDLRTNTLRPTGDLRAHTAEVRARFSDERWRQFVTDHQYFLVSTWPVISFFRYDHGYNPPPNWTFAGRLLSTWLPATEKVLQGVAVLDFILLGALFVAIYKTYGPRIACLSIILFGLGAPWRYDWTGGAFLRNDWLLALGLGLCLLKRERFAAAGFMIGYAASIRVFPAAFLVGPALLVIRDVMDRKPVRWFVNLCAGVAASLVLAFALGCLGGGGFSAWQEFVSNITKHHETVTANSVGLKSALLVDAAVSARKELDKTFLDSVVEWVRRMDEAAARRRPVIIAASAAFTLIVLAAMWRRKLDEAAILGMGLIFALMTPSCYYFVFLLFVPLLRERWLPSAAVLSISGMVFFLRLETRLFETIYGTTAWALLVFFLIWLTPEAIQTFRALVRGPDEASA